MLRLIASFLLLLSFSLHAKTIKWYCDPGSNNRTSGGLAMDGSFRFELGVFKNSFVPTSANTAQWAVNWAPAQRALYNASTQLFTRQFTVSSNQTPFVQNAAAYIWGFGGANGNEWILLRASSWLWPQPDALDPFALEWNVADANQVICGSINANGALMQSALIANSVPPATSYAQWQGEELSGVAQNAPEQDADGDGIPNVLEFVLGSPPQVPNVLPSTPVSVLRDGGADYLQILIPRRADRTATMRVERSTNLVDWTSGASVTQVTAETPLSLTARSLLPIDGNQPRQFLRFVAQIP